MEKGDLKICVYAICKNEEKFVDRWVSAMIDEADYVVVLDTGSTDSTVEKLKAYEPFVTVKQYDYFKESGIFRFDRARNDSMKLIPNDVDICAVFDLDQVPQKGWSSIVREEITNGNKEVRGYIVDHNDSGEEVNRWESRNVHVNDPFFIWTKVIHEGIEYYGKDKSYPIIFREDFVINHYPDNHKDRTLYKTLLEYACKEYPTDPYYAIYLGIELERRYSKEDACKAFRRALSECIFDNSKDIEYQICINLAMITDSADEALVVLNRAKEILAYELTKLVHGEEEAEKAQQAARALFSTGDAANMPTAEITADDFRDGVIDIISILQKSGLVPSRSEGRRAVEQGGVSVDGEKVTDFTKAYTAEEIGEGIVVKRGKKNFRKVVVK